MSKRSKNRRLYQLLGRPSSAFPAYTITGLTCMVIILAAGRLSRAAPLAYEGFEYEETGEQLLRQDGGSGFIGQWRSCTECFQTNPLTITEGSLYHEGLNSSGNRLNVDSTGGSTIGLVRYLENPISDGESETIYMSFLIRPEHGLDGASGPQPAGWGAVGFIGEYFGQVAWAGYNGNEYRMQNYDGAASVPADVIPTLNEESLFVVRADMTPGVDTFTFHVNPALGEPEPNDGKVKTSYIPGLQRIFVASGRGSVFSIDEIRIGETFADVTPNIEPGTIALQPGDADQDLDFDQLDVVRVQTSAKYLTGEVASWGEGDWDGAPGGGPGSPPAGDGLFNQFDIIAAQKGATYLTGPYAAVQAGGTIGDEQTSLVYNAGTGEVAVDAPSGVELTSINIDSESGIFTGEAATNLGGSFDNDADANIFKATFGSSFGSLTFGIVAQTGLSEEFVLGDLTVIGSLAGGGDLGNVDLVYVPEPASALLLAIGLVVGLTRIRRRNH